eukprot:3674013-Heterocapsa_arctica.AAC.1
MAYELNTAHDALHAANCRWENDNQRCTAQLAALKNENVVALERSAAQLTRDSAAHARANI